MNLRELFKLLDENRLVLPDFQRDYVWKKEDQKALIASLILNLPIGSFLLLSGNKEDFATKELGFPTTIASPKEECKYLLDGQQRLTSLRSILYDMFQGGDWSDVLLELYNALRFRWFLRIVPRNDESDVFGWKDLWFDKDLLLREEPSTLRR